VEQAKRGGQLESGVPPVWEGRSGGNKNASTVAGAEGGNFRKRGKEDRDEARQQKEEGGRESYWVSKTRKSTIPQSSRKKSEKIEGLGEKKESVPRAERCRTEKVNMGERGETGKSRRGLT